MQASHGRLCISWLPLREQDLRLRLEQAGRRGAERRCELCGASIKGAPLGIVCCEPCAAILKPGRAGEVGKAREDAQLRVARVLLKGWRPLR